MAPDRHVLKAVSSQLPATNRGFSAEMKSEYARTRLLGSRMLIRAACTLGAIIVTLRVTEQILAGRWIQGIPLEVVVIAAASLLLAALAWSRAFERHYIPVAQMVVPVRNLLGASAVTAAAAQGQAELLMILPLMIIGPFFFLGLGLRAAIVCVFLTVASFAASAAAFELAPSNALRAGGLMLIAAIACVVAALRLEEWARTAFLESHLAVSRAEHDALTGLSNRRVFDEQLERFWQLATDSRVSLAIVLMDVDHFKAYNDVYGHQAGDLALQRVAQTLRALVPGPEDVLARYGGEEFALIMYDVDGAEMEDTAARMRRAISDLGIVHRESQVRRVTISAGVAVVRPSAERGSKGALQLADEALYEAKVRGRNRVAVLDHAAHELLVTGVFSSASFAQER